MDKIRLLQDSDSLLYRALRLNAFQESPFSFSESLEDEQGKPQDFFHAAMGTEEEHCTYGVFEESGLLAGIATFKRDKRSKARHKGYLHTMYVSPERRGGGLGKALLLKILQHAQAQAGLEQIHLWVLNPEVSPAKKLYQSVGFTAQGTIVRRDLKIHGRYVDAEYMVLELADYKP